MINYCDDISVLTRTTVSDSQGGLTETWSNLYRALFDIGLSVGTIAVADLITGSINGYTAVVVSIDYTAALIEYTELSNDADFEATEELAHGGDSVTVDTVVGAITSLFRGRLSPVSGNELILASRLVERSTHVLYCPHKNITALNRITCDNHTYEIVAVYDERDLFGTIKHMEIQLELIE